MATYPSPFDMLMSQFAMFNVCLAEAGDPDRAKELLKDYDHVRRSGANQLEALLDIMEEWDGGQDPETGTPNIRPIQVPESCVTLRDELIAALLKQAGLQAEVASAERAAGWDPSP